MSLASFAHQEVLLKNLFMRVSNFIAIALIVALLGVNAMKMYSRWIYIALTKIQIVVYTEHVHQYFYLHVLQGTQSLLPMVYFQGMLRVQNYKHHNRSTFI